MRWKPRVFVAPFFQGCCVEWPCLGGWVAEGLSASATAAGAASAAFARAARAAASSFARWHCLYFLPEPQWQGSLRPSFEPSTDGLLPLELTTGGGSDDGGPDLGRTEERVGHRAKAALQ